MRITQWIIFVISFMLIFANLRMMSTPLESGAANSFFESMRNDLAASNPFTQADAESHTIALARRFVRKAEKDKHLLNEQHNQVVLSEPEPIKTDRIVALFCDMLRERIVAKRNAQESQFKVSSIQDKLKKIHEQKTVAQKIASEPVAFEQKKLEKKVELVQADEQLGSLESAAEESANKIDDIKVVIVDDSKRPLESKRNELEKAKALVEDLRDENARLQYQSGRSNIGSSNFYPQQQQFLGAQSMPQQMIYQQPQPNMMQNNGAQMASMAMQLQASAMAMQQQASALMMQAQQQLVPAMQFQQPMMPVHMAQSQSFVPQNHIQNAPTTNKEKLNQLIKYLQQMVESNGHDAQRLLSLLDQEFDIVELLMSGTAGSIVERAVVERNKSLKHSNPLVVAAYDIIMDLSSNSNDDTDVRLYRHYVRKGKKSSSAPAPHGKKKFLVKLMSTLEHYYDMIENMQSALNNAS